MARKSKTCIERVCQVYSAQAFKYRMARGFSEADSSVLAELRTYQPQYVLDLGCGTAKVWERALQMNRIPSLLGLTLLDISKEMLDQTRQVLAENVIRLSLEFVNSDMQSAQFDSHRFNAIVAMGSLHHMYAVERCRVLRQIRDWLSVNGVFIILEDWAERDIIHGPLYRLRKQIAIQGGWPPLPSKAEYLKELRECGFQIVRTSSPFRPFSISAMRMYISEQDDKWLEESLAAVSTNPQPTKLPMTLITAEPVQ